MVRPIEECGIRPKCVEVRGFTARDISSLATMGQGPDTFPELFAFRCVRLFGGIIERQSKFSIVDGVAEKLFL